MRKMNIRPAYRYRILASLRGAGIFYGVMILVTAAVAVSFIKTTISFGGETSSGSFSSYGASACIMAFVFGICYVREDLRLCIQHGIGRRTVFVSELLSALSICIIVAVAGELLLATAQAVTAEYKNLQISDLYQGIYADWKLRELSLGQHFESMLLNLSMLLGAYMAGMFISLTFYRLNKVWKIIVAVGAPVLLFVGLPILLNATGPAPKMGRMMAGFMDWVLSSPWAWVFVFMLGAVALAILNWLLIRHAPIKAAKG